MKKIYQLTLAFSLSILLNTAIKAQNWTVGVPVDMSISYLTRYGFDCATQGQADFNMNIILNSVDGIQYIAIVDSVQNIAIIMSTTDTLMQGDTLLLSQGNNNYAVSFVNGTGNINFNFKAVGTPTTAGVSYPCAFNDAWMSNFLLCNEGLTLNVQNNCTVDAASSIKDISNLNRIIQFPAASNQFQLQLNGYYKADEVSIFDITGKQILLHNKNNYSNATINCDELTSGIYFVNTKQNNQVITHKFVINK